MAEDLRDDDEFGDGDIPVDWDEADNSYQADAHKGTGETDVPQDDYLVRIGTLDLKRGKQSPHRHYLGGQLCILRSLTLEGEAATENAGMNIWTMFMLQGKPFSLRLTRALEAALGINGDSGVRELVAAAQDSTVRISTEITRSKQYGAQLRVTSIDPPTEEDLGYAALAADDEPF